MQSDSQRDKAKKLNKFVHNTIWFHAIGRTDGRTGLGAEPILSTRFLDNGGSVNLTIIIVITCCKHAAALGGE